MDDLISRQAAIDEIKSVYEWHDTVTMERLIEHLNNLQPIQPVATDTNVGDKISKFIDGLEEIFAYLREKHVDDSVCGLCEYDGAYIGQSGDWCNECPGFERDDCFKLSDKTRKEWTDEIIKALPSAQPETHEERTKTHACDLISRQAAIDVEGLDEQIRCEMCRNPMHTNRGCDGNCKYDEKLYERIMQILGERIKPLPSAESEPMCINLNEPIKVKLTDWGKPIGDGRPLADSEVIPRLQDIKRQIGGSYAIERAIEVLEELPPASPDLSTFSDKLWKIAYERGKEEGRKKGKWTTEEVAELLFNACGDDCACNLNGIDEWLPERCKYTQIADECPNPKEKHGCWMQFLLQGGAAMNQEE